jgi:tetratricopeptide (TPR) repeat protein
VLVLSASTAVVATPVPLAVAATKASNEAAIVAKQALQYYNDKQWAMAAELYRRAYRIDPTKPEYLFGVGRAEQRAGRYKEALLAFETLLTILPEGDGFRAKAQRALDETRAQQAQEEQKAQPVARPEPEPGPEPEPVPAPAPATPEPKAKTKPAARRPAKVKPKSPGGEESYLPD